MTKFSLLGVLSCVAGGLLIGFQALSSIVGTEAKWKSLAIVDIVNEKSLSWVNQLSSSGLEGVPETIVNMPLFVLLFCLGGLFFVLD